MLLKEAKIRVLDPKLLLIIVMLIVASDIDVILKLLIQKSCLYFQLVSDFFLHFSSLVLKVFHLLQSNK